MDDLVDPYDMKITTKVDVNRVQKKCLYSLVALHRKYDTIIVVLGQKYREVLTPILDSKCLVIRDSKGLFAYYKLFARLNKMSREEVLEGLVGYRVTQCHYYENEDFFPHTCYFCNFRYKEKCALDIEIPKFTPIRQKTTSKGEL